jgi:hypothetical protein
VLLARVVYVADQAAATDLGSGSLWVDAHAPHERQVDAHAARHLVRVRVRVSVRVSVRVRVLRVRVRVRVTVR